MTDFMLEYGYFEKDSVLSWTIVDFLYDGVFCIMQSRFHGL